MYEEYQHGILLGPLVFFCFFIVSISFVIFFIFRQIVGILQNVGLRLVIGFEFITVLILEWVFGFLAHPCICLLGLVLSFVTILALRMILSIVHVCVVPFSVRIRLGRCIITGALITLCSWGLKHVNGRIFLDDTIGAYGHITVT